MQSACARLSCRKKYAHACFRALVLFRVALLAGGFVFLAGGFIFLAGGFVFLAEGFFFLAGGFIFLAEGFVFLAEKSQTPYINNV
jgi:hypothetical protein